MITRRYKRVIKKSIGPFETMTTSLELVGNIDQEELMHLVNHLLEVTCVNDYNYPMFFDTMNQITGFSISSTVICSGKTYENDTFHSEIEEEFKNITEDQKIENVIVTKNEIIELLRKEYKKSKLRYK